MSAGAEHLEALLAAERQVRVREAQLLQLPRGELVQLLRDAVRIGSDLEPGQERSMRLERLADLCAQVPGPDAVAALLRILDCDEEKLRAAAGEALVDVAYERYAEVARAIETALDEGQSGLAMEELPFLLVEVPEPGSIKLLKRFLQHPSADVVAAAIEAAVTLDAEELRPGLVALREDSRLVRVDDPGEPAAFEGEEDAQSTVGDLASQALEELGVTV